MDWWITTTDGRQHWPLMFFSETKTVRLYRSISINFGNIIGSRGKETPSRILQLGGTAYSAALCCLVDTGFDLCNDHIREKYYLIDNQEVLGFQIKFRSLLKKKTT
uniref:Uncharacterized protein n=2 Tax=Oryza TaxID=4527 RepID=A0A0E0RFZ1_ORYRU